MQRIQLNFDYKKATQALNYLAIKEGGRINKMKALKLIYFAERYHLRKYGRLITNDVYLAMKLGPVPSGVKDIAEASNYREKRELEYSSRYIEPLSRYTFKSLKPVDDLVFSESDIEALDFARSTFGNLDRYELARLTHEYPEWKKHKRALKVQASIQMSFFDFFDDPGGQINRCFELSEEEKAVRREQLEEMDRIEFLWR